MSCECKVEEFVYYYVKKNIFVILDKIFFLFVIFGLIYFFNKIFLFSEFDFGIKLEDRVKIF